MSGTSKGARSREQRQQRIVDHVLDQGSASAAELTELVGVSLMTVHRDLDELVRRGLLRKFHGGVSAQPSTVFEGSSEYRMGAQRSQKETIARTALTLVEPGGSILLDDSTSALAVARLLADIGPLTVATNYLPAIEVLKQLPEVHLICLGGNYSATHDSFLGLPCIEAVGALSVDMAFVSTSAMNATMTYHQEHELVQVKRAMLAAAETNVLLMDSSKMPRKALHRMAPLSDYDHLVVDDGADEELIAAARDVIPTMIAPLES
ncbi:DeoR/GlpR family DNA-binding transcription regulator [Haloactinomyces albus]|uniref:Lactose phosphotransferase system repressor n=1 Tax=Haloactinomyces albus TaxID=1352928 RepID=A0AAE3ZE62_9ACTN|nr:DeoR/GlpR family DNA-binding transcription regulator [Haloactinomyces albus]MDR7301909.1 DeoR/GlpR family transcriptional regulator of sugar metabolism [Haloactinomyces albus]